MGRRIDAFQPSSLDKVPEEGLLSISDLSKPEIKNYMDEEYRKKALGKMIVNAVDKYKANKSNFRDYNDPQVRKEINEQTTTQQIKKAKEYTKSNEKNI